MNPESRREKRGWHFITAGSLTIIRATGGMRQSPLAGSGMYGGQNRLSWLLPMKMNGFGSKAIWALGAIGDPRATAPLRSLYRTADDETQDIIQEALKAIRQNTSGQ